MNRLLLAASLLLAAPAAAQDTTLALDSPDATLRVAFALRDGRPTYELRRFGRPVLLPSPLGLAFREGPPFAANLRVGAVTRASRDTTWTQPWGEVARVRDRHEELRVELVEAGGAGRRMAVVFRAFEDGVGFRYELPAQPGLGAFALMDELTEFRFPADHRAWWIPAYHWNRYEYLYSETPLSAIDTVHTPVTLESPDGLYVALHEAALTDWASMTLAPVDSFALKADLVPWGDGVRVYGRTPAVSPWRTIQVGDAPGDLATSYLVLNLNEPSRIADTSWIRPEKYVGVWWEMHIGPSSWGSGPTHGATTANARRYVDFAAENGIPGVLVEGWNVGWDVQWGDGFRFTEPHPDFDLEGVAAYARERGVHLIGHHETGAAVPNYERQMEEAFALYERLGVPAVKTGYVGHGRNIRWTDSTGVEHREWHHGQYMVRHHRRVLEAAARHRIVIDAHEPIKDTGERRTWPNMMTREGARGQEYNAWSDDGGNPPEHEATLAFTRMLSGPMDFTPGIFRLTYPERKPNNRVNTTLAKQLALFVVLFSPLQMAADLPENYAGQPAFQFIRDVPTDWAETRVLHGRIGDYATFVRKDRHSEDWYLGSVTDEHGRVLEAPLAFLDPGRPYVAEVYRDADDADWETNPLAVAVERVLVDGATVMRLRLAAGGGMAVRFRPATESEAATLPRYARP